MIKRLTFPARRAYASSAADFSAVGFGDPEERRTSRQQRGFFHVRQHGTPGFGRAVRETFGSAGSFSRFANLHGSAPSFGDERRFYNRLKRSLAMSISPEVHRQLGYLPFIHRTTDELHDALFLIADATRGLHAVVRLCQHYRENDDDDFDPRELAGLLEPLYRRIADAIELEAPTPRRSPS